MTHLPPLPGLDTYRLQHEGVGSTVRLETHLTPHPNPYTHTYRHTALRDAPMTILNAVVAAADTTRFSLFTFWAMVAMSTRVQEEIFGEQQRVSVFGVLRRGQPAFLVGVGWVFGVNGMGAVAMSGAVATRVDAGIRAWESFGRKVAREVCSRRLCVSGFQAGASNGWLRCSTIVPDPNGADTAVFGLCAMLAFVCCTCWGAPGCAGNVLAASRRGSRSLNPANQYLSARAIFSGALAPYF